MLQTLNRMLESILLMLVIWTAVTNAAFAQAVRPSNPVPVDAYGYALFDDDDAECGFEFVDIRGSGEEVSFAPSATDPAEDDGGAVVPLAGSFEFYGDTYTSLVMSTNAYLAFATDLATDSGGDFSNDARLPAIPDTPPGVSARLMVYHDDLSGYLTGGAAYTEYFAACPRASEALGSEPCTVLQWTDWGLAAGGDPFDLQAILYHATREIVVQVRPGSAVLLGGTTGIQDGSARRALQYRRDPAGLAADTAVCFFEPRFPPGGPRADLRMLKTDKVRAVASGESIDYAVSVINDGPSPVSGATVTDRLPAELSSCSWVCEASAGSACAASGTDDIDDVADIAAGGWVDYLLTCEAGAGAPIVNTAAVDAPPGVLDPEPRNNSARDVDNIPVAPSGCAVAASGSGLVAPSRPPDRCVLHRDLGGSRSDSDPTRRPTPRRTPRDR